MDCNDVNIKKTVMSQICTQESLKYRNKSTSMTINVVSQKKRSCHIIARSNNKNTEKKASACIDMM